MSDAPSPPTYSQFADAILTTRGGLDMYDVLLARFPGISRHDCFLGIAIAWAITAADLTLACGEVRSLRYQIEQGGAAA